MGNHQAAQNRQNLNGSRILSRSYSDITTETFSAHWDNFMRMTELTPECARDLQTLPLEKRMQMVRDFESLHAKMPAVYYIEKIKNLLNGKPGSLDEEVRMAHEILKATEISLRTSKVEWLYDFLRQDGLQSLTRYLNKVLEILIRNHWEEIIFHHLQTSNDISMGARRHQSDQAAQLIRVGLETSLAYHQNTSQRASVFNSNEVERPGLLFSTLNSLLSPFTHKLSPSSSSSSATDSAHDMSYGKRPVRSSSVLISSSSGASHYGTYSRQKGRAINPGPRPLNGWVKNLLHIGIKCLRVIFNNQQGCQMAFKYTQTINVVTLCLLHPSDYTKTQVLHILTALCLIKGGHERVLASFDYFKAVIHEARRFQTLIHYFKDHERFPPESYNCSFMISCAQFFNVLVHSVEHDINLRVALQYEMQQLGLDRSFKNLSHQSSELQRQVSAYLSNSVNVTKLVADVGEKRVLIKKTKELEIEVQDLKHLINKVKEKYPDDELFKPVIEPIECVEENNQSLSIPIPPPPPPPPLMTVPPPPPPPLSVSAMTAKFNSQWLIEGIPIKTPQQPKKKLIMFNWNPMRNTELRNTIFTKMTDNRVLERIDWDELEQIFQVIPIHSTPSNETNSTVENGRRQSGGNYDSLKRGDKRKLVNDNRHKCLGILRHYIDSYHLTPEGLARNIAELQLKSDVADRILRQIPTPDEIKMYRDFEMKEKQPLSSLSEEDVLLFTLCKVKRLPERLALIIYMESFEDTLLTLKRQILSIIDASSSVKNSKKLLQVLEIVLAIGNYMNGARRGVVYGFRLQSLDLLADCRSQDRSCTLLEFIVQTVEAKFPEALNFFNDLLQLQEASKIPLETLSLDVNQFRTGMQAAVEELNQYPTKRGSSSPPQRLVDFVAKYEEEVEIMHRNAEKAKEIFLEAALWFGETNSDPTPEHVFGVFHRFVHRFQKCHQEIIRRRRRLQEAMENQSEAGLARSPSKRLGYDSRRLRKSRTRQINDGVMDEILLSLVSQPLDANVH